MHRAIAVSNRFREEPKIGPPRPHGAPDGSARVPSCFVPRFQYVTVGPPAEPSPCRPPDLGPKLATDDCATRSTYNPPLPWVARSDRVARCSQTTRPLPRHAH